MSRRLLLSSLILMLFVCLLTGCSQPVRQDRAVQVSDDGKAAAFVDNTEGVFVTDTNGDKPVKIFTPPTGTSAVSVPLWAPGDRRLIFTVARKIDPKQSGGPVLLDDPEGAVHFKADVAYIAYLRAAPQKPGDHPEPQELFRAACDHPGYVAANLAVRWRPDGQALLFVQQIGKDKHIVCEYELKTQKTRRVFPHEAAGVVFDFSPDGRRLACVVGGPDGDAHAGVWMGTPGGADWWVVPSTETNAHGTFDSVLERLKAGRPSWAPSGSQCLLTVSTPERKDEKAPPSRHSLLLASPSKREVRTLFTEDRPLRDLAWAPDGSRFGLVRSSADSLRILLGSAAEEPLGTLLIYRSADAIEIERVEGVRRFAGWDRTSRYRAYLVSGSPGANEGWLYLLPTAERVRDVLLVQAEGESARAVLSGIQVSFLKWMPTETKLTLWASYRLSNGSPSAQLLCADVPPGDPVMLLDPFTSEIEWKPVKALDKVQIAHYYLIQGDAETAWRWYQQADQELAADNTPASVRDWYVGRNALLYHAVCLERLGRHDEARVCRERFENTFPSRWVAGLSAAAKDYSADDWRHIRDLYVVEVLLSVKDADQAERYLGNGLKETASDSERLGKALLLSQVLLLRGKNAKFAEVAADFVLPLLAAMLVSKDGTYGQNAVQIVSALLRVQMPDSDVRKVMVDPSVAIFWRAVLSQSTLPASPLSLQALLPLATQRFLATLPESQVRRLVERLVALRRGASDDARRLGLDILLAGAYGRLGEKEQRQEAVLRIADNPARESLLGKMKLDQVFQVLEDSAG